MNDEKNVSTIPKPATFHVGYTETFRFSGINLQEGTEFMVDEFPKRIMLKCLTIYI